MLSNDAWKKKANDVLHQTAYTILCVIFPSNQHFMLKCLKRQEDKPHFVWCAQRQTEACKLTLMNDGQTRVRTAICPCAEAHNLHAFIRIAICVPRMSRSQRHMFLNNVPQNF